MSRRVTVYWDLPGGGAVCRLDCHGTECAAPVECVRRLKCDKSLVVVRRQYLDQPTRALNDYEMGAVLRLMGVDLW